MLGILRRGKSARWLSTLLAMTLAGPALAKQMVVKVSKNQDLSASAAQLQMRSDTVVLDVHEKGRLVLVEIDDSAASNIAATLSSSYEYAVDNVKFHAFSMPNDPNIDKQWALKKVRAAEAWKKTVGSRDVVVAIIDTGIDWQHEDLKDAIWHNTDEIADNGKDDDGNGFVDDVRGWDFHGNDANPTDETSARNPGHGTHCAGIVGAVGDNAIGVSGMSQQVTMMPVRFLGADGSGNLMAGAKAIDYAVDNGAHIISASWGAAVPRSGVGPILEAIQRAEKAGVIFVAAAANDGRSNDTREVYPANAGFPNVISVAASNADDAKPSWSNYGKATVDLASPGADIYSTLVGNKYDKLSGTSMATPLVAGLVALMMDQAAIDGRTLEPLHYKAILQASGAKVAIETACNCRIDAAAALNHITNDELTIVPNAATLAEDGSLKFSAIGGSAPYSFQSSDETVASISEDGELTAIGKGEVTLTVTDKDGETAISRAIYVGREAPSDAVCPLQNEILCMLMCLLDPELPWCSQ